MHNSSVQFAGMSRNRIGNVHSVTGSVSVERTGDFIFQGYPGDAIYSGDVVATGPRSAATIALNDGTCVRLSAGARLKLDDFVCNQDRSATRLLLADRERRCRSQQSARAGHVGIDNASGSTRGRAAGLGLRMLSLAVVAYALLRDLQYARALSTDDDTITPKDSEYGSFEIVTKSGTVILVDDPGLTYLVDDAGTVERQVNSSSRMDELQLAQQAVLGTQAHGLAGPPGSGTPLDAPAAPDSQPLTIPIDFRPLDPIPERIEPAVFQFIEEPAIFPGPPPTPQSVPPVITTFTFDSGLDGDRITNNNSLVLIGTATPGTTVSIFDGGTLLGNTTADASGSWSFDTGPLSDGEHAFAAAAGAPAAPAARLAFAALAVAPTGTIGPTSAPFVVIIDTKAPSAPVIDNVADDPNGPANGPTSDSTPTLVIAAEAGSTVHVYRNGTLVGTATETGTPGIFTFASEALADGCYTFTATATDIANNTSPLSCEFNIDVDGTPPSAPVLKLADHSCCPDNLTDDSTPTLIIAAEAGSTVRVYRDGEFAGTAVESHKAGIFTFTSAALNDGSFSFTATATDSADNVSPLSTGLAITLATADPNDFDALAMNDCIYFGPDGTVHGTPKGDTISFRHDDCEPGRTVYAGAGNDTISGTHQSDTIYGGSGKDKIYGAKGADTIFGGFGNDNISGGKGNDIIAGGYGADILSGGNGADTFVFLSPLDSPSCGRDIIVDFDPGCDRIDLHAIDANSSELDDQPFMFAGQSNTVVENSVTWYYDHKSDRTYILADTDGDADTAELDIVLAGNVTLTENNFIL
jgi:Ca2+-binding RTX toxin-like protein